MAKWQGTLWNNYGGIIMSISSSLFFSISFIIIKVLDSHCVKPFGAALLFNLWVLVLAFIGIVFSNKKQVFQGISLANKSTMVFLTMQGMLQGSSVILRTVSLAYLSVGDMTVIVFSSPVVTTILAHFVLGEPCGLFLIVIVLFTFVGVGLITKPPVVTGQNSFDRDTLIGSAIAFGAMLCLSMKFVVTRKIKETHWLLMTFFLGLCGVLISLPLFLIFEPAMDILPSLDDPSGLFLRVGMFTAFIAVMSINLALKMEDAGLVALVRSFDVIFAFLLQYIFLGVVPDLLSGIGASIVWMGVVCASIRKHFDNRKVLMINQEGNNVEPREKITFVCE